ncbi:hypothetical protein C1X61_28425 [Pseudomonas sp. FW215-T2]|nr:hypothetical protein C1X61_28425 [Pseudomonas sp. FW215-T2]PNA06700.1 hypothetical protein C1X62_27945 [Pseudomonas sp. FW215-R3]PNB33448.1 hypothetical protein C1X63_28690 [Pseudomonas sp. FW305-131]
MSAFLNSTAMNAEQIMIVERRLDRLPSGKSFTGLKHINSALIELVRFSTQTRAFEISNES